MNNFCLLFGFMDGSVIKSLQCFAQFISKIIVNYTYFLHAVGTYPFTLHKKVNKNIYGQFKILHLLDVVNGEFKFLTKMLNFEFSLRY